MTHLVKYLLFFAVVAFGFSFLINVHLKNHFGNVIFEPVRAPVEISEAYTISRSFTVNYECDYGVSLECERVIPFHQLERLMKAIKGSCDIFEDGVKRYSFEFEDPWYGTSSSNASLARMFPRFPAFPGKNYRIDLRIEKAVDELDSTHPKLVVEMDSIVYKTEFFAPAIPYSLASLVLKALGILLAVVGIFSQARCWMKDREFKGTA